MWIQRWLGEAYSSLYSHFGTDLFTLQDAREVLKLKDSNLHVAFSMLHSAGAVIIFARGRPRTYRLLDPRSLMLKTAGVAPNLKLAQEEYLQLIYDTTRALRQRIKITSLCVYGSVARGEAKRSSDVDLLVVSDDLRGSIASRIDYLSTFVDEAVSEEVRFLRDKGYTTMPSLMPLTRQEAKLEPAILLDLTVNAKMILDEEGFLGELLRRLRARLDLAGARRVQTERGWYWDLRPDYKRGETKMVTI